MSLGCGLVTFPVGARGVRSGVSCFPEIARFRAFPAPGFDVVGWVDEKSPPESSFLRVNHGTRRGSVVGNRSA